MAKRARQATVSFDAISIEGGLIAPAMLAKISLREADGQTEPDYGTPKGLTIRDEIARYFRMGQALFLDLVAAPTQSTAATVKFVEALLRDVFGFADIKRSGVRTLGDRHYPLSLEALGGRLPVVIVPPQDDLDRASERLASEGRRRSAASTIQDWLNASDEALWGLCCNGERLRLVRDNESLTRPAYIEADLRQMFEADGFADFTTLWLLIHATRFGAPGAPPADCALERWRDAGAKAGLAVRDRLRDGVEAALLALGGGFLAENPALREKLHNGELPLPDYFGQLLRLIYRLIFLLVAEERGLLHAPDAPPAARKLYADGYSLASLRERAIRRAAWDRHHDRWEGLLIVFSALSRGEPRLGLPALGGLFLPELTPDLLAARLPNRALMEAIYRLAWLKDDNAISPVNWRDMETEELGSVYESLLELTPRIVEDGRGFAFAEGAETKGHARKTTGSYYTPDSLVQTLLDSALDPVLDRVERESDDPAQALLGVSVIDPACGSGHFLLAAARRIATRVARIRAGGVASAQDFRHALRDVARNCIHGVDRNPMAVELTKVALWIETVEPGKPLGFLDASIRCGDALLGIFDLEALRKGIPDEAYKPLAGDDKDTAKYFASRNRAEKKGQGELDFGRGGGRLPTAPPLGEMTRALRALPEDNAEQIAEKAKRFAQAQADQNWWIWRVAADLYVAAFLAPKTGGAPENPNVATIPTSAHVWQTLGATKIYGPLLGRAVDLAGAARAFHWPLEFPDVMAGGGFDVVLGNPPWERIKLQEQEFFASRDPEIAEAPTKAARAHLIQALKTSAPGTRRRLLLEEYQLALRVSLAMSLFARESGRFPLSARGDINTYGLFAELFVSLTTASGYAGAILKAGIVADFTNREFLGAVLTANRLRKVIGFNNKKKIFPAVHPDTPFVLITLGSGNEPPKFAFELLEMQDILQLNRYFDLTPPEIAIINPNTRTVPMFRSSRDAAISTRIYSRIPILINGSASEAGNSWNTSLRTMFHKSNASEAGHLFPSSAVAAEEIEGGQWLPVHEGEYGYQFDHRYATFENDQVRAVTASEHSLANFEPNFELVARKDEYCSVLERWHALPTQSAILGFRRVSNAGNERTSIAAILPMMPLTYGWIVLLSLDPRAQAVLCANFNSLIFDYLLRNCLSQPSIPQSTFEQIPTIPRTSYSTSDIAFVLPRTVELTYTSHSMAPFARDLGYDGPPFAWDEDHRARLRAELDAFYARAYGLTRDELRYILDPADVMGADYPSETFRVLKNNEIRRYGEYRTARLVLDAWDRIERGELVIG